MNKVSVGVRYIIVSKGGSKETVQSLLQNT